MGLIFYIIFLVPAALGIVPGSLLLPFSVAGALLAVLLSAAGKKSALLRNVAAMICSAFISLAVVDLLVRAFFAAAIYPRPEDQFLSRHPAFEETSRFSPCVNVRRKVSGDLAGLTGDPKLRQEREVVFQTDEAGFRNVKSAGKRPIDLFLVGDSVGAGMNESQEKIWSSLFEEKYGLRTYNLSTGGCPWDYLMNLKIELPRLQAAPGATLVFVVSASNDLTGRYEDWTDPRPNPPLKRAAIAYSTFRNRSPIRLVLQKLKYLGKAGAPPDSLVIKDVPGGKTALFLKLFAEYQAFSYDDVLRHENFPKLKRVITEARESAEKHGVKMVLVVIPPKEDVYSWVYHGRAPWTSDPSQTGLSRALEEIAQAKNIPFYDAKADLIGESERVFEEFGGDLLWWYDDSHWNRHGHEAAARLVHDRLLKKNA